MIKIETVQTDDHFSAVRALLEEYLQSHVDESATAEFEALERDRESSQVQILLAHQNRDPAGCVALLPLEGDVCEMKRLYVSPRFRSSGIGRGLVMTLLIEAEKAGYRKMRLDTGVEMKAAQSLYRSIGFREVDRPDRETCCYELCFASAGEKQK